MSTTIELFDTGELIRINGLKEISDPVLFDRGATPSPRGLLSTDIFGVGVTDRKETFAYIDLTEYFLHPYIYSILKRLNRKFEGVVSGNKNYIITADGKLEEVEEGGETGIAFLYKNWEKINFSKNASNIQNERIDVLLYYPKETLFTRYWLVIPAFYRDVNLQNLGHGKISNSELNNIYTKLLRLITIINSGNNFSVVMNTTKAKIQDNLGEIYDYFEGKLGKKTGLIRRSLLGKSIDYGLRVVISAPTFNANKPSDMVVDFKHVGLPLAYCTSLFTPFIVNWLLGFFRREFEASGKKYLVKNAETGETEFVKLKDPELYFSEEYIIKKIDNFINNGASRFDVIELPLEDPKHKPVYMAFSGRIYDPSRPETQTNIDRPATWTDLLYQASVDITSNKHVWITRYPLLDYFGTFPSKIAVMSTKETIPVFIGESVYEHYPHIKLNSPKMDIRTGFLDTITMSNVFLKGLGGDYDGDQITVKGVFTQEANEECERIMNSKSHIVNINGENMRTTTNEGIQTLYMLTKF